MHAANQGEALDEYLQVFAEPGALTAALNWYRASALDQQMRFAPDVPPTIHMPALFIGGLLDGAVAPGGIEAQAKYMAGSHEPHMREAGHWLMSEDTDFVVSTILDFVERVENSPNHSTALMRRMRRLSHRLDFLRDPPLVAHGELERSDFLASMSGVLT